MKDAQSEICFVKKHISVQFHAAFLAGFRLDRNPYNKRGWNAARFKAWNAGRRLRNKHKIKITQLKLW